MGRREPGRCSRGQGFDGCGISGGEPQEKHHLERAQGPGLHREPCRGSEGVLRPVNLCEAEMFLHLSQLPLVSQRTENARRVEKKGQVGMETSGILVTTLRTGLLERNTGESLRGTAKVGAIRGDQIG